MDGRSCGGEGPSARRDAPPCFLSPSLPIIYYFFASLAARLLSSRAPWWLSAFYSVSRQQSKLSSVFVAVSGGTSQLLTFPGHKNPFILKSLTKKQMAIFSTKKCLLLLPGSQTSSSVKLEENYVAVFDDIRLALLPIFSSRFHLKLQCLQCLDYQFGPKNRCYQGHFSSKTMISAIDCEENKDFTTEIKCTRLFRKVSDILPQILEIYLRKLDFLRDKIRRKRNIAKILIKTTARNENPVE